MKKNKFLYLHFIVLLWGLTPVLGKLISLQALDLVWWRLVMSAICLLIFIFYKKITFKLNAIQLLEILAMGGIVGLHWYFFYHAIKISNVSIALAGFSTITLFASLLQPFILNKRFFWGDVFYGLVILIALVIILQYETLALYGLLFGVLSAITGAVFSIYNGKLIVKHDSSIITFVEFIGAFILISVYKLVDSSTNFLPILTTSDFIFTLILSVLCTTIAFTLGVQILKYISPFTVVVTNNLEPVYGILFSVLLFGESEIMSVQFYIGAVLILLMVFSYPYFKRKFYKENLLV